MVLSQWCSEMVRVSCETCKKEYPIICFIWLFNQIKIQRLFHVCYSIFKKVSQKTPKLNSSQVQCSRTHLCISVSIPCHHKAKHMCSRISSSCACDNCHQFGTHCKMCFSTNLHFQSRFLFKRLVMTSLLSL